MVDHSVRLDDTILVLARSYRSQHGPDALVHSRTRAKECQVKKDIEGVYVWNCVGQVIQTMDELDLPREVEDLPLDEMRLLLNVDSSGIRMGR